MGISYDPLAEETTPNDLERKDYQVKRGKRFHRSTAFFVCALFVGCLLVASVLTLVVKLTYDDIVKFHMPVKENSDVMQFVHSSVKENYVQYIIEVSDTEKSWVLDDFNTNLEIMKNENNGHSICFVSKLNRSEAMAPSDTIPEMMPYKQNNHGVYTPDEEPTEDLSFLSPRSRELCEGANVYWLNPAEVIDVTDPSVLIDDDDEEPAETHVGHRSKRNVRTCHTSCCWLVCCCNTHHFVWESSESFTCRHVCNKCTKKYKSKIQKLC